MLVNGRKVKDMKQKYEHALDLICLYLIFCLVSILFFAIIKVGCQDCLLCSALQWRIFDLLNPKRNKTEAKQEEKRLAAQKLIHLLYFLCLVLLLQAARIKKEM